MINEDSNRDIFSKDSISITSKNVKPHPFRGPIQKENQQKHLAFNADRAISMASYAKMDQQLISDAHFISQEIKLLLHEISKLEEWANGNTDLKQALHSTGSIGKLHFLKKEFLTIWESL